MITSYGIRDNRVRDKEFLATLEVPVLFSLLQKLVAI